MKFTNFLPIALIALFAFVSCEKQSVITEEDYNTFDAQPKTEHEILYGWEPSKEEIEAHQKLIKSTPFAEGHEPPGDWVGSIAYKEWADNASARVNYIAPDGVIYDSEQSYRRSLARTCNHQYIFEHDESGGNLGSATLWHRATNGSYYVIAGINNELVAVGLPRAGAECPGDYGQYVFYTSRHNQTQGCLEITQQYRCGSSVWWSYTSDYKEVLSGAPRHDMRVKDGSATGPSNSNILLGNCSNDNGDECEN